MRIVNRHDILSALATGLITGAIAWRILVFLGYGLPLGIPSWVLAVALPLLWIAGVQLGYALGVLYAPLESFGRFVCVGFANALVDFGVLYLLIGLTGLAAGLAYAAFKTISFGAGTVHSYFWNKYWAFNAAKSAGGTREVVRFLLVVLVSILVNVVTASMVVALRPETFTPQMWAGIGAVAGSGVALIVSFIGFRLFVFTKK